MTTTLSVASLPGVALRARLVCARDRLIEQLLSERSRNGAWTGELSASALSTATAITALRLVARNDAAIAERVKEWIERGHAWLVTHQNSDGGWGDTTNSLSNISTTALVWAALGLAGETEGATATAITAAERWLRQAAGSLEPDALVAAIEARYGADRTFSIPILTMCALCGRLGPEQEAWARVRQLPFEIAMLPQRWFGALQLPVVSYALPALIAIGQVRHAKQPVGNPLRRALRTRSRAATLKKLASLQPANGGFLEATPLTSFVTMSLAAMGLTDHQVVQRGVAFLERSAWADGSWPIDTNLSTWLTTLSVNAVGAEALPDRAELRDWLLHQQYRSEHPYTLAAPGGWAWTDLPGGVPDADDTAGALLALHRLGPQVPGVVAAATAGVKWLLNLQNRDGGVPTFCRGWGKLPFDRSSPDITAHAMRAWATWRPHCPPELQRGIDRATAQALTFLKEKQGPDGAWIPLWFGNQHHPDEANPVYGTSRVLLAVASLPPAADACARAVKWLVSNQNTDGSWSGVRNMRPSVEETALALEGLAEVALRTKPDAATTRAIERGTQWLVDAAEQEKWRSAAPVGFYFAKLWYHERLYPLIFTAAAFARLTAK